MSAVRTLDMILARCKQINRIGFCFPFSFQKILFYLLQEKEYLEAAFLTSYGFGTSHGFLYTKKEYVKLIQITPTKKKRLGPPRSKMCIIYSGCMYILRSPSFSDLFGTYWVEPQPIHTYTLDVLKVLFNILVRAECLRLNL